MNGIFDTHRQRARPWEKAILFWDYEKSQTIVLAQMKASQSMAWNSEG
jgi:hypothetical protein